ncbi:MAG: DUF3846 domain-containing protein [Chitinophagales bacterium]
MSDNNKRSKEQSHLPALLYTTEFSVTRVKPANGRYFTLEEMQRAVGGRIEIVPLEKEGLDDRLLVVHEEGKLISPPLNVLATFEWMRYYGETDFIFGDCIICHPDLIR